MFFLLCFGASAQELADFEWEEWNFYNGIAITHYAGTAKDVTIPAEINGMPVTAIGEDAFYGKQLTGVTLPDSITYIGMQAFSRNMLTCIAIPPGVTSIETDAFMGNNLESVIIGDSITQISTRAFYSNDITSITIGSSVDIIREGAFMGNRLTCIVIPPNVKKIVSYAFVDNPITSITIGEGVSFVPELGQELYGILEDYGHSFEQTYMDNGKRAGTYTRPDPESTVWSFLPPEN